MKAKLLFPYRLSHWFGIMLLACTVSHTPMSQTDLLVELDIPVPGPETYATALLLLLGAGWCYVRRRKAARFPVAEF